MGPAGADGADGSDGTNGVDGNVTCLVCHSGTNMDQKQAEFAMSAHSVGAIAVDYAGGQARCAPCHSHEQFVQTMTLGSVAGDITNPSAWECSTCHGIHKSFEGKDYALRTTAPVVSKAVSSITMDLGGHSNLCATCHQTRTAEPNTASPGETFRISNTHYGPHHGPQGNVVAGVGFAEIAGDVPYPAVGSNKHLEQASCTGCHMAEFGNKQGGHSFIPSVAACNECHDADLDDYNYGGVRTEVEGLLEELRDELIALNVVFWDDAAGAYEPVVGTHPMVLAQSYFNWIGLEEDRSLGAHNPKYVKALLLNTIQAVQEYAAANSN
ncbi:hypothetical protein [Maribellus sp. YY47]|uniref:hypothetical protein n=1 Tax=Maribellus sp. YY47 TaxID=2929486 RepID=UPI002001AE14|nr:hypothetical protein [Maribellus sp. YY47]MCK3684748.1 hypothetical protein [Maribellus sp. YY47]